MTTTAPAPPAGPVTPPASDPFMVAAPGASPEGRVSLEMDDAPALVPVTVDAGVLEAVRTIAATQTHTKYIYIDKMAPAAIDALTKQLKLARDALGLRGRTQDVINPKNGRRALFVKLYGPNNATKAE